MKSIQRLADRYGIRLVTVEPVSALDPFRRGYSGVEVTLKRGQRRATITVFIRRDVGDMNAGRALRIAARDLLKAETSIRHLHSLDAVRRRDVRRYVTASEEAFLSLIGEARLRRLKETYSEIKNEMEAIFDDYNLDGYETNV